MDLVPQLRRQAHLQVERPLRAAAGELADGVEQPGQHVLQVVELDVQVLQVVHHDHHRAVGEQHGEGLAGLRERDAAAGDAVDELVAAAHAVVNDPLLELGEEPGGDAVAFSPCGSPVK